MTFGAPCCSQLLAGRHSPIVSAPLQARAKPRDTLITLNERTPTALVRLRRAAPTGVRLLLVLDSAET